MTPRELKGLVRRTAEHPSRISLDDGGTCELRHPDFAFLTEGSLILARGPGHDFGPEFVVRPINHIARVQVMKREPAK